MINQYILKNKEHFIYLLFLSFFIFNEGYAQQTPHYTQYLYNMQVINPAAVGSRSDLNVSLLSRDQWVGVAGAPSTKTLSISGRTNRGLALGLSFVNDKIGLAESTDTNIDVSYTIITSEFGRLAVGLKGGLTFFDNNLADGITPDSDVIPSTNGRFPNVGFGAYYYTPKFFVGVSVPRILKTTIFNTSSTSQNQVNYKNYFVAAGTIFTLSENILLKPTTLIKHASNLPISIDVNTNFLYKNFIEAGVSYRYNNSVSALFSVILKKKFRIGYTYDYGLDNFGNNLNTHEILLHLDLNLNRGNRWLNHNKCYF